jgi:hypothetical protein
MFSQNKKIYEFRSAFLLLSKNSVLSSIIDVVQRSSRTQTTNTIKYESKRESSEEYRIKIKGEQIYQAAIRREENTLIRSRKIEQVEAEFNRTKSMRFRYNGDRRRYRTRKVLRSRKENL